MTTAPDATPALTASGREPVPITAGQVHRGDVLVCEGREIQVTAQPRPGWYWFGPTRHEGLAIDWKAGTASGIMFRRDREILHLVRTAGTA